MLCRPWHDESTGFAVLNRLPRQLPPLSLMLADIGEPKPAQLARLLGVKPATVSRWIAKDAAPLPVLLAIFWLTRWGRSQIDADMTNAAQLHADHARALGLQLQETRAQLARLAGLVESLAGAANGPLYHVCGPCGAVPPLRPDAPPPQLQPPALLPVREAGKRRMMAAPMMPAMT